MLAHITTYVYLKVCLSGKGKWSQLLLTLSSYVPLSSGDHEKYLFCLHIWSSKYLFLLMSVTKQGQSGRFTPQWHPRYSVALLPSVSPWLPQNINPANKTLTQKFPIALTEIFFTTDCQQSPHTG